MFQLTIPALSRIYSHDPSDGSIQPLDGTKSRFTSDPKADYKTGRGAVDKHVLHAHAAACTLEHAAGAAEGSLKIAYIPGERGSARPSA